MLEQLKAASDEWDKACTNSGGVGVACFDSLREQQHAMQQAHARMLSAATNYIPKLREELKNKDAEIERLREAMMRSAKDIEQLLKSW